MSNTQVRIFVGLIGIPLVVLLAVLGNQWFLLFSVIVSIFCMNEFYNFFEKNVKTENKFSKKFGGFTSEKMIFLMISSLIVVAFYYEKLNYVLILYFFMFIYLITSELFKKLQHFESIGTWLLAVIYISTPFGLASLMASDKFIEIFGTNYTLITLILIWSSDTFAFFGGKKFGKHKMAERISPKKTWEGSIFGFFGTILIGILISLFIIPDIGLINIILISIIVGFTSQIGDLFESYLKRSVNLKDSSDFIPGHGGVLDRFDSLLFAIPAVYIYLYLKVFVIKDFI